MLLRHEQQRATGFRSRRLSASRLILLLTTILLVVMPATEHYWTWDRFASIGHDLEFSALSVLIFCGLVALIAQHVILSAFSPLMIANYLKHSPIGRLFNLRLPRTAGVAVSALFGDRLAAPPVPSCGKPLLI
jgi:hypothetical protein